MKVVLDPRAGGAAEVSLRHLPPFFREPLSCSSLRGGNSDVRGEHDQKSVIWPLWASVFASQQWVRDFSPAFRVGVRVGQALCVPACSGMKGRGVPPRSTSVLCIPGVLAGGNGGVASNHCLCHTRPVDPPESGPQTQHTWRPDCPLASCSGRPDYGRLACLGQTCISGGEEQSWEGEGRREGGGRFKAPVAVGQFGQTDGGRR